MFHKRTLRWSCFISFSFNPEATRGKLSILVPTYGFLTLFGLCYFSSAGASLVAQMVKNLPAMLEIQVPSLGHEDPLEKEMASHSSILARRISWTEETGGLQSMGSQESDMAE